MLFAAAVTGNAANTIAGDNHGKAIGESNRIDVLPPRQAAANLLSPPVSGG